MTNIPIDQVWFDRTTRQRSDLGDLSDLKQSISSIGLINPIVVTHDGKLIAGERRYTACAALGWTSIPVTYLEDMSETELEQVELDENIRRLQLPWKDHTLAIARYHELCGGTSTASAEKLGISPQEMSSRLIVSKALKDNDKLVSECTSYVTAKNILERRAVRQTATEKEELDALVKKPAPKIELPSNEDSGSAEEKILDIPIRNEDFHVWAERYDGPKFNFLHCDFPYGINADKHNGGSADKFGGYEDTEEVYWNLIQELRIFTDKHVSESAHMMFWFSLFHYEETLRCLREMGWTVHFRPLIWWRSDNAGVLPDPRRGPRWVYETCLLCTRGDRPIVRAVSDLVASPTIKEFHMSEKPRPVLEHFMRMFVDDSTRLLDPTCGSANALIVARNLGAAEVLGLERDTEFYKEALRNWKGQQDD